MIIGAGKGITKLIPSGAYTNEAGMVIGSVDNVITVSETTVSLWGLTVREPFTQTQLDIKHLEQGAISSFDFFNGILCSVEKRTNRLHVFKTVRTIVPAALFDIKNQYKHSLEEVYVGNIQIESELINVFNFIKNKISNTLDLVIVQNKGVSVYKIPINTAKGKSEATTSQIERNRELLVNLQNIIDSYENKASITDKCKQVDHLIRKKEGIADKKQFIEIGSQTEGANNEEKQSENTIVRENIKECVINALCKEVSTTILPFISEQAFILAKQFREKLSKEMEKYSKIKKHYEDQMNATVQFVLKGRCKYAPISWTRWNSFIPTL
eukprot:TRINITY_DN11479_c0_g1_i6.p1 TRINITY_DN11479_c0_g1~~TRINITY_DN11479_c0_g1_i6.p1  ORF type:complete len:326 (+),score=46.12 TRINITY_DN11479_c0_g1_i6:527-1504(+)